MIVVEIEYLMHEVASWINQRWERGRSKFADSFRTSSPLGLFSRMTYPARAPSSHLVIATGNLGDPRRNGSSLRHELWRAVRRKLQSRVSCQPLHGVRLCLAS